MTTTGRLAASTIGVATIALGAVLAVRPVASLALILLLVVAGLVVAAVVELLDLPSDPRERRLAGGRAALFVLAAAALVLWTGAGVRAVIVVVGLTLLANGVLEVWAARRMRGVDRWNALLGGSSSVAFGLLALAWPDVSVVLIGVLVGVRLVLLGARLLWRSVRPESGASSRSRRGRHLVGNVFAVAVALALVLLSLVVQRGAPTPDAFYTAPASVPTEPGQLLRSEPFTREIPDGARAWRILYTTTRDDGVPAVASGLVVVPVERTGEPTASEGVPVIAWAHGTTGIARGCAPTVIDPFEAGAFFSIDRVLDQGWGFVATDYVGLGTEGPHPYLIGQGEGRSVLDAVRAAHQLTDAGLGQQTAIWGHSQGGHAALWAGHLATTYAPDLRIDGVAALAPASNLPGLVDTLDEITGGELFASFVLEAYAQAYPDVTREDYVRPAARPIVRALAGRCLAEPGTLVSIATVLSLDKPIWLGDPNHGPLAARLDENVPRGLIASPLLISQGGADSLVVPAAQQEYVDAQCAAGQALAHRVYDGLDHLPLVEPGSPAIDDLVTWTQDRFAGRPAATTCP